MKVPIETQGDDPPVDRLEGQAEPIGNQRSLRGIDRPVRLGNGFARRWLKYKIEPLIAVQGAQGHGCALC